MVRKLQGKCKEYIENELCLGCERLAIPTFTGDDNCPYIKEREELENWIRKTRRNSMK
jgi:hypothetical protein